MITVSKQENGVLFTFTNSDKYLYGSGTIEVPFNSLSIIQDESDNITLRKSASNDIFLSARYDTDFGYASKEEAVNALKEILYDEAGISEEEVQEMIDAATSGMPSSQVIEALRNDINTVSGDVENKQDALSAGTGIEISGNVISATGGALLVNFDDLMENMNDEKWDELVDALQNNKPIFEGYNNSEGDITDAGQNIVDGYVYPDEYSDPDDEFGTITSIEVMSLTAYYAGGYRQLIITKKGSEDYEVSNYNDDYQPMGDYQPAMTAGSGISIDENYVISVTGAPITVDSELDETSNNPVANSAITNAIIDNEYTVSQAINSLNNRVTAVESGGTGGGISSGEVQTMIDDSLDIYWTSAQTQTAIDGAKAYYIDFATIMTQGIHDADWDGIVNAINAHRPIYAGLGGRYYTAECLTQDGGNKIIMTASDELNHYFYTFTKNGSENYSFSYETRPYVTDAEKNTWNTKQDGLVSGTNIKTINNESILGSGNISLQEKLVSGTNIKTVNNQSILGTGNIDIQTGSSVTVDSALNSGSTNPVQNKAIAANIIDHYESANDIMGKPRYLKAVTKSGGISIPLSLYFSTINNKDIFANNGNNIIPTVNTFSLVETSAITTSMTSSSTDAQVPSAKAVYDQFGGLKLVKLTQAAYDALATKDAQTLYIVVD